MKRFGTRGLTLLELVIVLTVFGVLFAIMIPNYRSLLRKARAAEIVADLFAVRAAGFTYFAENNRWPREYSLGKTPPELVNYLPRGFAFRKRLYVLDWDNWRLADGSSRFPSTRIVIGITFQTADRELARTVQKMLKNLNFIEFTNRRYTLEILGTGGL